ncbi:MAG: T9SS type A sorting domain-containing protein [Ignavibacteria bacterium]|nr:T9SS type A sorting domain-containing protein [Ignavibacteria bacterium]
MKIISKKILMLFILSNLLLQKAQPQWINIGLGDKPVNCFASKGIYIFAGCGNNNGVYRSTNYGVSWIQTSLNNKTVLSLLASSNYIFAGLSDSGVRRSSDNGISWMVTWLKKWGVKALLLTGEKIFAGTVQNGLWFTTNSGDNWIVTELNDKHITCLAASNNYIYAGVTPSGVWVSSNGGETWVQTTFTIGPNSLAVNDNYVYVATTNNGIFRSTDYGQSWVPVLSYIWGNSVVSFISNVFAGAQNYPSGVGGVWVSNNYGINWILRNEGLYIPDPQHTIPHVYSLFIYDNSYVLAGTSFGIYGRQLNQLINRIKEIPGNLPNSVYLEQNYPNPFNSSTKIRFAIPKPGIVKLQVFDVLGRNIIVLLEENLRCGMYEVEFNAKDLENGVYFYKLSTEEFQKVLPMLLIK